MHDVGGTRHLHVSKRGLAQNRKAPAIVGVFTELGIAVETATLERVAMIYEDELQPRR